MLPQETLFYSIDIVWSAERESSNFFFGDVWEYWVNALFKALVKQ